MLRMVRRSWAALIAVAAAVALMVIVMAIDVERDQW